MYIFYVASEFMEYVDSISAALATVIMSVCFAAIAFRKTKIFEFIDALQTIINESELDSVVEQFE